MINMLIEMAAAAHRDELRQAGERSRRSAPLAPRPKRGLEIRHADTEDGDMLSRLATLDEAPALVGPVLLASADGRPVAALSLADGRVVADPFVATAQIVSLLRARAAQLAPPQGRRRLRWRRPQRRFA